MDPHSLFLWWAREGSNLLRLALQANALPVELLTQIKAHFLRSDLNRLPFVLQTNALPIELLVAHAKELLSVPLINLYLLVKPIFTSRRVMVAGAGFEPAISNL